MSICDHARLAPSSAHRWYGCAASPAMEALYPEDTESEESREGTAAHWYLTETAAGRDPGPFAPNGYPINDEMRQAAKGCLHRIAEIRAEATPGLALRIEERVFAQNAIHEDNWGTPDFYLLDTPRRTLYILDYKYGHRYVDHRNNWQLIDYGAGILESEGVPQTEWALWSLVMTIAQPRNFSGKGTIRTSTIRGDAFLARVADLRIAAHEASNPTAPCLSGDHCRDCRAMTQCPAAQQAGFNAIDVSRRSTPLDLPVAALGFELRLIDQAIKRLEARRTGLSATAEAMLRSGQRVPGWKFGNVQSREKWKMPTETVIMMGAAMGVDLAKPKEAITPNQARDQGIDPEIVKELAERPTGATRLEVADGDDAELTFGPAPIGVA